MIYFVILLKILLLYFKMGDILCVTLCKFGGWDGDIKTLYCEKMSGTYFFLIDRVLNFLTKVDQRQIKIR